MINFDLKTISQEKKINMIFTYLFNNDKALEEEFFWNNLNETEIKRIQKIQKEEKFDLDSLKLLLGK